MKAAFYDSTFMSFSTGGMKTQSEWKVAEIKDVWIVFPEIPLIYINSTIQYESVRDYSHNCFLYLTIYVGKSCSKH